jgi:hypothetical protein
VRRLNKSSQPLAKRKVQKEFADGFKTALLPSTLEALLESRFVKHFAPLCEDGVTPDWNEMLACLRNAQPHFAMAALKTLLNSWCTRSRYHEDGIDECIFGCGGARDDISHYASCPRLWQVSCDAAKMPRSASVEEQLLLHDPSLARLDVLVTAYTVYHAVKRGHPADVTSARHSGDYLDLSGLMKRIATAHATKFGLGQYSKHHFSRPGWTPALEPVATIDAPPPVLRDPVVDDIRFNFVACASFLVEPSTDVLSVPPVLPSCGDDCLLDPRGFCEPECNDLPDGTHHPGCSQALLQAESNKDHADTQSNDTNQENETNNVPLRRLAPAARDMSDV